MFFKSKFAQIFKPCFRHKICWPDGSMQNLNTKILVIISFSMISYYFIKLIFISFAYFYPIFLKDICVNAYVIIFKNKTIWCKPINLAFKNRGRSIVSLRPAWTTQMALFLKDLPLSLKPSILEGKFLSGRMLRERETTWYFWRACLQKGEKHHIPGEDKTLHPVGKRH